jgi:hypothetical protein
MPLSSKTRSNKQELLVRHIEVLQVGVCVTVAAERTPDSMPRQLSDSRLVVVGALAEPVNDQTQAELRIYATDAQLGRKYPHAFGVIAVGASLARIGAFLRREHWPDVWAMATAGALKYCRITFTMPKDGQGVLTRLDLSSERMED